MIRFLTLFILLILPITAAAQTVPVRSGDHADFSRLLLGFDAEARWEFGRVPGGFEFRPGKAAIDYELGSVFDLITRNRIVDIEDRGGGRLFLRVDCNCHGDAFDLRDGQVVLDIKDGAPPNPSTPFEQRLEELAFTSPLPSRPETPPTRPPYAPNPGGPGASSDRASLPLTLQRTWAPRDPTSSALPKPDLMETDLAAEPEVGNSATAIKSAAPEGLSVSPETTSRASEIQTVLLEQIARAAAQGLLEAEVHSIEPMPVGRPSPGAATPDVEEAEPLKALRDSSAERSHMEIETGVDRATGEARNDPVKTEGGGNCIPQTYFDVAGWGGEGEYAVRNLGAFRGRTIGEFDKSDSDGVTGLVQHFIYLTFGAEALAMIQIYPDDVVRSDLLSIMAEVMDKGASPSAASLVDQMACQGETALWSVLAQPRLYRTQHINVDAVALAFAGLPPHIRDHLGAGLVGKFLDIGEIETADSLKNAIERGVPDGSGSLDAIALQFDRLREDPAAALVRLDEIVLKGDGAMPEALLGHVEAELGKGRAVSKEQISLLESLAFERRGSSESTAFLIAATRAHALAGDFQAAFAGLSEIDRIGDLETPRREDLVGELFNRLNENAADATFLRHLLPRLDLVVGLSANERRQLSERVLDLGLTIPGQKILGGEGALPEPPDRLLFARAAVLEGRPEVAIGYLAGMDSEAATRLRAEALSAAADYSGAFREYLASGDTDSASRMAWHGGLWEDLLDVGEGSMRDVARLMRDSEAMDEFPTFEQAPASLAGALNVIDESRAARAILESLLAETKSAALGKTD